MGSIYFLGSDRLPHCDDTRNGPDTCNEEVYFSGEVIKFAVEILPFRNFVQSSYIDANNNSYCGGYYYLPGDSAYTEGMNPPVVYGTPKFAFKLNSISGQFLRYAELSTEFSNVPQGYLEYHYTLRGTDNGTIVPINQYFDIVSDAENRITYSQTCNYVSGGISYGSISQTEFTASYLYWSANGSWAGYIDYPNTTNVSINTDSGSVSENQVRILLKRSAVASKVPLVTDLALGELAANTTDGIIFLKRANDSIAKIKPLEPQDYDTFAVTISADTDNLDLGIKALTRLSVSSSSLKISGFKAGSDGEIKMVYNAGPEAVKILNNSSNSDAANRIAVYNGLDFDLPSGYGVTIVYDGTSSVWRLF